MEGDFRINCWLVQPQLNAIVSPENTTARLGDNDNAKFWLEKTYRERALLMIQLGSCPDLDPIRPTPRFQQIARRMNFPAR